jgi:hypothetical protein
VSHTLTTHARFRDLDAAAVTDNTLVSDLFIFSAVALPVLGGSKNLFAEKAVPLRLKSPVIDGLRFGYFAMGP